MAGKNGTTEQGKNDEKKDFSPIYRCKTESKYVTTLGLDQADKSKSGIGSHKLMLIAAIVSALSVLNFGFILEYAAPAIPQLMHPSVGVLQLNADSSAWFGVRKFNVELTCNFFLSNRKLTV